LRTSSMASRVACSFMEIIIVNHLPFAGYSQILVDTAARTKNSCRKNATAAKTNTQKQKKPTLGEWAKVVYRSSLQPRPSHKFVWRAKKSVSKPKSRVCNCGRVGHSGHCWPIACARASVFRLSPDDNRILSIRLPWPRLLCLGLFRPRVSRTPGQRHANTAARRGENV